MVMEAKNNAANCTYSLASDKQQRLCAAPYKAASITGGTCDGRVCEQISCMGKSSNWGIDILI